MGISRNKEIRDAIDAIIPISPTVSGRTYEQALIASGFEAGVKWADEHPKSPWISVDEDLPCNHEALLVTQGGTQTIKVITAYEDGDFSSDFMIKDSFNDNWDWNCWNGHYAPNYWMIPPKLPKE